MSSRIFSQGEGVSLGCLVWRQMGDPAPVDNDGAAEDTAPAAQDAEMVFAERVLRAREQAFREGEAQGRAEAVRQMQPILERLAKTIAELDQLRPSLRRGAESDLLKLAVAIARRILHRELTIDPDAMQGLLRVALDRLGSQEISRVRVHPRHEGALRTCLRISGLGRPVEVVSDASLELGGAIFETSRGNLDASLASQLDEVDRGLADQLRRKW